MRASDSTSSRPEPEDWQSLLLRFLEISSPLSDNPIYGLRRVKQWLRYASQYGDFAAFTEIKRMETEAELRAFLPDLGHPKMAPACASQAQI